MNIFSKTFAAVKRTFGRGLKNLLGGSRLSVILGGNAYSPMTYQNYALEGLMKNPIVFACLDFIGTKIGELNWRLYDGPETNKKRKPIESHPFLDLINDPDPTRMSRAEWWKRLVIQQYLEGDSFILKNKPTPKSPPKELNLLRPDLVSVDFKIGKVKYSPDSSTVQTYDLTEVIRNNFYNPLNDNDGLSPLMPCAQSINLNNEARNWNLSVIKNSIALSMYFTLEGEGLGESKEATEANLKAKFAGSDKAGDLGIFEGGLKPNIGAWAPKDMDWKESASRSGLEIMAALHIAPELLGDQDRKTFANYETALKSFYTETLIPLAKFFRDNLNRGLGMEFQGKRVWLELDTSEIKVLAEEEDKKVNRVALEYRSGLILLDEARADLGKEPLKPGQLAGLYTAPSGADQPAIDFSAPSKSFSPEQKARRKRRFQLVEGYRNRFEKALASDVRDHFGKEMDFALSEIRRMDSAVGMMDKVNFIFDHFKGDWKELLRKFNLRVIQTIGANEWDEILLLGKGRAEFDGVKKSRQFDPFAAAITQHVESAVAEKVKYITATSKRIIKAHVQDAIEAGDSIQQIAESIEATFKDSWIPNRAEMVARTETIGTTNFAGQEVAGQTGLKLRKDWISTLDGRGRGSKPSDEFDHVHMDGKQVALNDFYVVSGERLMYPGGSSHGASAGNIIQCRCAEGYIPEGE